MRVLAIAREAFPVRWDGSRAEADLDEAWSAFAQAVRAVSGQVREPVAAIVISSQMAGLVLLDERYRPALPYILGVDERPQAIALDDKDLHARTGRIPGVVYPVDRLAWFSRQTESPLSSGTRVGGLKEFLLHRLTGEWATDPSSASATGLYDQLERRWSRLALEHSGVGASALPRIVASTNVVGGLSADVAGELGMAAGVQVVAGLGDGPAANLSVGAVAPGSLCLSLGTTLVARLFVTSAELPDLPLPLFRQEFDRRHYCAGVRIAPSPTHARAYELPGTPSRQVGVTELPSFLAGFVEAFGVNEVRVTGGGSESPEQVARLKQNWSLPVLTAAIGDGTRGAALVALAALSGRDVLALASETSLDDEETGG